MDPLAGTPWSSPRTVEGFVKGEPNKRLLAYAAQVQAAGGRVALDIGCGAGRNTVPLADLGWRMLGTDLSWAMLEAAQTRASTGDQRRALLLVHAPMEALPVRSASVDLVIAHGIWNLATSDTQFRTAVAEAARVVRPGGSLFLFTFSRRTLPPEASPLSGQALTFTQFSGTPQIFLTEAQLRAELGRAGFQPDETLPLVEHNAPAGRTVVVAGGGPVIYEVGFIRSATA
ncbi:MAG: class I SAM-dependent methyltransferase [Vicinamibacterales bacterium]